MATDPTDPTDQHLLEAYAGGDLTAFEQVLDRHQGPLLRFVGHMASGSSRAWAEDIVQEVFLRLLQEVHGGVRIHNLSAWLFRVARNLFRDHRRKEGRMEKRHQARASVEAQPPAPFAEEERELTAIVASKLRGLPENQRDVLILKIQEGKSYKEIAAITGLTTSNIGYLIHHGLKALARDLRVSGVV